MNVRCMATCAAGGRILNGNQCITDVEFCRIEFFFNFKIVFEIRMRFEINCSAKSKKSIACKKLSIAASHTEHQRCEGHSDDIRSCDDDDSRSLARENSHIALSFYRLSATAFPHYSFMSIFCDFCPLSSNRF